MSIRLTALLRKRERRRSDPEYRKKQNDYVKAWIDKNQEHQNEANRRRNVELNLFANKHCEVCGKLLSHINQSGRCLPHRFTEVK